MKNDNSLFRKISRLFVRTGSKPKSKQTVDTSNLQEESPLQQPHNQQDAPNIKYQSSNSEWLLEESASLTVRYLPVSQCESKLSRIATLSKKLDNIVVKRKLYLDPNLSLTKLSMQLGVNRTYMSNILREKSGFKIFVNTLRIDYFSEQLDAFGPYMVIPKKDIARLAMQSGFSDMRTFKRTVFELNTPSCKRIIQRIYSPLQVPEEEQIQQRGRMVE